VARFDLPDHTWRQARYLLPASGDTGYHRIEIRVSPTWSAPDDPRELGVMVDWQFR
jgi:hypothetical protein